MGTTLNFRTSFARGLMIVGAVIGAALLVHAAVTMGLTGLRQVGPIVVASVSVCWLLFGNPQVEVSDGGVRVVNILRWVHIPWPTLDAVTTRWSLTLETSGGTFSSWAIPAASGMSMRMHTLRRSGRDSESEAVRELAKGNNADAVALVIGERVQALSDAGHLDGRSTLEEVLPQWGWNTRELIVLALCAAAVALAVLS